MSEFRTIVSCHPSNHFIGLKTPVLTIGSCFADAIGERLKINKIISRPNPFGVIYNPDSIHKALQYSIHNAPIAESSVLLNNERYLSYDFHSEISSTTQEELLQSLTARISEIHGFVKGAQWLIITYGTAWVYHRKDTGEIVANCHKMPSALFTKSLLTQKKIIASFDSLYRDLKRINPTIQILLTVSPVRHLKDTLELNSVSKSVLRVACHALTTTYGDVHYFPAYEMMMDDLRDYRFYKADMIHPSDVAEEYIWEKFVDCYGDTAFKSFLKSWKPIVAALSHKPFHHASHRHQHFLQETLKKLEAMKTQVNVDDEIRLIKSQQIRE